MINDKCAQNLIGSSDLLFTTCCGSYLLICHVWCLLFSDQQSRTFSQPSYVASEPKIHFEVFLMFSFNVKDLNEYHMYNGHHFSPLYLSNHYETAVNGETFN